MASLTLKNIPDDLLDALHEAAEMDRRSLNQEILFLLSVALQHRTREPAPARSVAAQVRAWRRLAGKWRS